MTTAVLTKQENSAKILRDMLNASKAQIAMALPRHLTADRMIRVAMTAYQSNGDLLGCDLVTVVASVIQASQLGLDIGGVLGQCYLVPFYNNKKKRSECQLIVGYKGYLALARRSGEVAHFGAYVVHENDEFAFQYGTAPRCHHVPNLANPGEPTAVYSVLRLKDGSSDFEVIGWPDIIKKQQKHAKRSRDGGLFGPWMDHLEEMARKTAIRLLAKRCPVSVEFQNAVSLEDPGVQEEAAAALTSADRVIARVTNAPKASKDRLARLAALSKELAIDEGEWAAHLRAFGVEKPEDLSDEQAESLSGLLQVEAEAAAAEGKGESAT